MKLNPIFTDHMVFAANKPVRVYGEGEGEITVSLAGQIKMVAAQGGQWMAELEPMNFGGPYELKVACGAEEIVLSDVHVGLVYLCAGQSNMQLRIDETNFPEERFETNESLRFFATTRMEANEPFSPADGWTISTRETAARRSAIGYLMGNEIARQKGVAVGIVCCYQGASIIEAWVPAGAFEKIGVDIPLSERHPDRAGGKHAAWNEDGALYELSFGEVRPFAVNAVVWYQGESDASVAEGPHYARELKALIDIWREDLRDDRLPFVIVQLADYLCLSNPTGWQMIQQAQMDVRSMTENVSTIVCKDVCENDMIHPVSKEELSRRAAQAILEFE